MPLDENDWIIPPGDVADAIIDAAEFARAATRFWFRLSTLSLGAGLAVARRAERAVATYEHRGEGPVTIPLSATLFFTPGP